jgi:hypothetical protein
MTICSTGAVASPRTKVLGLYREKYFDLNVQHFHEKLGSEHGIEVGYTWVKQALQGAGLVARGRVGCIANGARAADRACRGKRGVRGNGQTGPQVAHPDERGCVKVTIRRPRSIYRRKPAQPSPIFGELR